MWETQADEGVAQALALARAILSGDHEGQDALLCGLAEPRDGHPDPVVASAQVRAWRLLLVRLAAVLQFSLEEGGLVADRDGAVAWLDAQLRALRER